MSSPLRNDRQVCARHDLATYEREDAQRPTVERFIQGAFAARHGARIHSFLPTLLALEGRDRRICGVVGFRNGGSETLFLEQYLSQPVERVLSDRVGTYISRDEIVEVGNLASLSCRAAFHLAALLPRFLIDRGNRWIVFTATSAVRNMLEQFHVPAIELAGAARECVARVGDDWGSYYDKDPRVMAGYLPNGLDMSLNRVRP